MTKNEWLRLEVALLKAAEVRKDQHNRATSASTADGFYAAALVLASLAAVASDMAELA